MILFWLQFFTVWRGIIGKVKYCAITTIRIMQILWKFTVTQPVVEDDNQGTMLMHENVPSVSLTTTVKYFTAPLVSLNQLQLKVK